MTVDLRTRAGRKETQWRRKNKLEMLWRPPCFILYSPCNHGELERERGRENQTDLDQLMTLTLYPVTLLAEAFFSPFLLVSW